MITFILALCLLVPLGAGGALADDGSGQEEQAADPFDRVTLAAGPHHFIGLKEDGTVIAGMAKDGEEDDDHGQCDVSGWTDIVSVAGGGSFSLGLKSDGTVVEAGGAGGGTVEISYDVSDWTDIVDISAGYMHAVGLRSDGTVVTMGYGGDGQCDVDGWTDIVDVATGAWHTLGLRSDGTVVAVGDNDEGQCNVSGWTDIVAIDGNCDCSVGLKSDGTVVYAGGDDDDQQDLSMLNRWSDVAAIRAYNSTDIFAITTDGQVLDVNDRLYENGRSGAADVAFADWYNRTAVLKEDGTVEGGNGVFDGEKLQLPTAYAQQESAGADAGEQDMGVWSLEAYVDEFDLPTDEYYIVNRTPFGGTFSNSATTKSELKAFLFYEPYDAADYVSIRLLEYGDMRVKNPYSSTREYDIVVMDNDGNKSYLSGSMFAQDSDIVVGGTDAQTILDALKKGGTVRFAITESEDSLTKYVITIDDATGFNAAFRAYWDK